jgi:hypothetical protein
LKIKRAGDQLRNKRGYCSLRIPESVAISVHKRMSVQMLDKSSCR